GAFKNSLFGFTQGTILNYAVALSPPELVRNVISLCGYINEKNLGGGFRGKNHGHLEVYASHGQVDQVIPLEWAQRAPGFLEELGIAHTYEEFPIGHGVSQQNFLSFRKWLSQRI